MSNYIFVGFDSERVVVVWSQISRPHPIPSAARGTQPCVSTVVRLCLAGKVIVPTNLSVRKKAGISRRYHWFSREMMSEKRAQKFHTDDVSLSRFG